MSAIEKITRIIAANEGANAETIATKIKARKKADLKVLDFTATELTVATDEGTTLRIVSKTDASFAQFTNFLKRKTSVLLPKMELVATEGDFQVFKTESLKPLAAVIGDTNAAFAAWLGRYADARKTGKAVRGTREEAAPAAVQDIVHVGNLRGLVNKIVQSNTAAALDFSNFSVRENADGTKQIVVNSPFAS